MIPIFWYALKMYILVLNTVNTRINSILVFGIYQQYAILLGILCIPNNKNILTMFPIAWYVFYVYSIVLGIYCKCSTFLCIL